MEIKSAEFIKGIKGSDPILDEPIPQIAFIGRSNVGKSSTINVLVNKKNLVKTSSKPGKTREINFFLINDNIYFVDLPGYGFAKMAVDKVNKMQKHIIWYLKDSDLRPKYIVVIIDARLGLTDLDKITLELLDKVGHNVLIVANKIDKLRKNDIKKQLDFIQAESRGKKVIAFSATKKIGKQELLEILLS